MSDFRRVSEALRFALVVNASFKEAAEPVKELGPVLLTLSFLSDSLTQKMHALQRAERSRCGSARQCHMLSFPKSRKTHVTKNNTKHCCTKLLVILVRQIFGRVSDGAVSGMAFLDDDSELAEDATRG